VISPLKAGGAVVADLQPEVERLVVDGDQDGVAFTPASVVFVVGAEIDVQDAGHGNAPGIWGFE
jgi:hypothetical protein